MLRMFDDEWKFMDVIGRTVSSVEQQGYKIY